MYASMNNNYTNLIIINGADHSLNYKTKTDDSFNQEPELQHVKTEIEKHFLKYM